MIKNGKLDFTHFQIIFHVKRLKVFFVDRPVLLKKSYFTYNYTGISTSHISSFYFILKIWSLSGETEKKPVSRHNRTFFLTSLLLRMLFFQLYFNVIIVVVDIASPKALCLKWNFMSVNVIVAFHSITGCFKYFFFFIF